MNNIKVIENEDKKFENELGLMLHAYNRANCEFIMNNSNSGHSNMIVKNFAVYDSDKLIGGAVGWIELGWYFLDQLYFDENYRKQGIGTMIINKIDEYAKTNNCVGIKTETWSFQAKGFYEKQGFEIYGQLDNYPPNAIEYYLKKVFK